MQRGERIPVLDHGFVRLIESYGRGDADIAEAGIIEAARQSTQGSFRGWGEWKCKTCNYRLSTAKFDIHERADSAEGHILCSNKSADLSGWEYAPQDAKLLGYLFNSDPPHSTPFEFAGLIIEVKAPILVFREWHRHRTQSYNEASARYAPLPDEYYMPDHSRLFLTQDKNKQAQAKDGAKQLTNMEARAWLNQLDYLYDQVEKHYQRGMEIGVPKEVARVIMPVGHYSKMRASANLLNWLKFCTLRMHPNAQWEIRQYANAVGEILQQEFPRTYELFDKKRPKGGIDPNHSHKFEAGGIPNECKYCDRYFTDTIHLSAS